MVCFRILQEGVEAMASYLPERFATQSLDAAIEIARSGKFATVIHADGGAVTTVHAPFTALEGSAGVTFVGHLARNNPLCEVLQRGSVPVRLIFLPAEGYVSPKVYAEKTKSGKVVPTWNYVAAHIDGELALVEGADSLLDILNLQSNDYEDASGGDWRVGDAPDDYIAALSKAIVGLTFAPKRGLAIEKLSQNRPTDLAAITDWVSVSAVPARTLEHWMGRQKHKARGS